MGAGPLLITMGGAIALPNVATHRRGIRWAGETAATNIDFGAQPRMT